MINQNNKNILTREGLKELKEELKKLVETERPKVIIDIKEARGQGDLSENAEFDAAREKQGQIENRITKIEKIIQNSKILVNHTKKMKEKKVIVGSKVTIENIKTKEKATYTIVGTLEANPLKQKISNESPLAMAIFNLEEGAIAKVNVEIKYDVKIIKVEN